MNKSIFDYRSYKKYLVAALASRPGHGLRSRLAEALGCQPSFISRVLSLPEVHFSQEHAILINRFLQHSEEESHFFMLLLHHERAGAPALEEYYLKQIEGVLEKRRVIAERIQVKSRLSAEDQMVYYSTWYYAAIHIALMVPQLQTKSALAEHFGLSLKLVSECLEFLVASGLAVQEGARFRIGTQRIHLSKESPLISKHHTNWRMRSIQSLERPSNDDLHYSGPMCISEQDSLRVREALLKVIEDLEPMIRESKEEAVFCLGLDFFRV